MAKALNEYLNRLSTNQVRTTNMFEMYITSGFSDIDAVLANITMYGHGFSIPQRTTNYQEVSFKGMAVPIPTNQAFEQDHTMTVNADANGEIRRAFLAWQGKTWDPDIEGGSVFAGDRRLNTGSIIRIHLLDNDMESVSEIYKLIGVRIASVGPLAVSNTDASVSTFDVQFKSVYHQIEKGSVKAGAFSEQV